MKCYFCQDKLSIVLKSIGDLFECQKCQAAYYLDGKGDVSSIELNTLIYDKLYFIYLSLLDNTTSIYSYGANGNGERAKFNCIVKLDYIVDLTNKERNISILKLKAFL